MIQVYIQFQLMHKKACDTYRQPWVIAKNLFHDPTNYFFDTFDHMHAEWSVATIVAHFSIKVTFNSRHLS